MYDFSPILQRIKDAKTKADLTNDDLSNLSGIPIGTLNKILAGGTKEPKLPAIIAIANALNVSADFLIYGKRSATPSDLSSDEEKMLSMYRDLNDEGKEQLVKYADFLSVQDEYKKLRPPAMVENEA